MSSNSGEEGSGRRLKLETVAVSLTDRCNLRCSHCGSHKIYSGKGPVRQEIDRATLMKLFVQFRELGATTVILSGGEPLLRKDLIAIIGDLGGAGLNCVLATNGTLLTSRILGKMKASGVITCVRLSVEFPASTTTGGNFHDAEQVFSKLKEVVDCGIAVGINMTLLPGNLKYILELAGKSREAGASFFRAVPLFPVGRSEGVQLPFRFFTDCIEAMLTLFVEFTAVGSHDEAITAKALLSAGKYFSSACYGGTRAVFISADGRAYVCALSDQVGQGVSVTERPISECIQTLAKRRRLFQQKIIMSPQSRCRHCGIVDRCRGGCLVEWAARGSATGGQPCCYERCWRDAIRRNSKNRPVIAAATELVENYSNYLMWNQPVPCLRSLPLWTVRL